MNILYLGPASGTSGHRMNALRRLHHHVHVLDPHSFLPSSRWLAQWIRRTGALFLESYICSRVLRAMPNKAWDLAYVDGGILVGPSLVVALKERCARVINYNLDDPFGPRDLRTWNLYLKTVPYYDMLVVVREANVSEAHFRGATNVHRVFLSADEVAHSPIQLTSAEQTEFGSEVLFVGTWMPERGPFLARLLQLGVPLTIYGNRWKKAPEWPLLQHAWRGSELNASDGYRKAILASKICLGLLSKGNRDQSTTRSSEITLLGRVLCAERTTEHLSMYQEGQEAEFWSTPEECAEKCRALLADDRRREDMAARGRNRCLQNRTVNEAVLSQIMEWVVSAPLKQEAHFACR